jgi:hypothetical protein
MTLELQLYTQIGRLGHLRPSRNQHLPTPKVEADTVAITTAAAASNTTALTAATVLMHIIYAGSSCTPAALLAIMSNLIAAGVHILATTAAAAAVKDTLALAAGSDPFARAGYLSPVRTAVNLGCHSLLLPLRMHGSSDWNINNHL